MTLHSSNILWLNFDMVDMTLMDHATYKPFLAADWQIFDFKIELVVVIIVQLVAHGKSCL